MGFSVFFLIFGYLLMYCFLFMCFVFVGIIGVLVYIKEVIIRENFSIFLLSFRDFGRYFG